jgi:hypothetical protein
MYQIVFSLYKQKATGKTAAQCSACVAPLPTGNLIREISN